MSLVIADPAPRIAASDLSAPPVWLSGGRIPCLDGLRAFAVLLVVYAHASRTTGFPDLGGLPNLRLGQLGVEAFLVVSGFLISTLLLRELHRTGQVQVGRFYRARLLKIVPPLAALLLVLAVLRSCGMAELAWYDFAAAATFTTNFLPHANKLLAHTWTLAIQEHFYLLWPVLLVTCSLARSRLLLWLCIAGCLVLRCLVVGQSTEYGYVALNWTCCRLDGVAVGCLLALTAYDAVWRQRLNRLVHDGRWLLLVGGVLLASRWFAGVSWRYWLGASFTLHSFCFAILLWAVIQRSGTWVGRCFDHPLVTAVGAASFSLYIWQQLFLQPYSSPWWCAFPQNVLFALLAGLASYWLIEKPILNFKQRQRAAARRAPAEPQLEAFRIQVWEDAARQPAVVQPDDRRLCGQGAR